MDEMAASNSRSRAAESFEFSGVPFSAGGFPSAGSSTMYASGPVRRLDTVQIDVPNGVTFLDSETHLTNYRAVLDRMEQRSLEPGRSRDFIRTVLHEL